MRLNQTASVYSSPRTTFEGAPAAPISKMRELERTVSSCFLWEKNFYESGEDVAVRIAKLSSELPVESVLRLALRLRKVDGLRHAPLLMTAACAARRGGNPLVSKMIAKLISRPDEAGELMLMIAKIEGRSEKDLATKTPACARRGIAKAMKKFDAYQLGKYNRDGTVKLRDVLRMTHPKPLNDAQSKQWEGVIDGSIAVPDTWEVALSGGESPKSAFERLLRNGKMPYLALLRNLRKMTESGVDRDLMREAIIARKGARLVLPFRYIAAARACPSMEPYLDEAMCDAIRDLPRLSGKTVILVDVSGSMRDRLSHKSDMNRMDAAAALASMANVEDARVFTFSNKTVEVPRRLGMSGVDVIIKSQPNHSTNLAEAITHMNSFECDRLIVITDEQANSRVPDPKCKNSYLINVSTSKNTINFGAWTSINGFSENIFRFIEAHEGGLDVENAVKAPSPKKTKPRREYSPCRDLSEEDFEP